MLGPIRSGVPDVFRRSETMTVRGKGLGHGPVLKLSGRKTPSSTRPITRFVERLPRSTYMTAAPSSRAGKGQNLAGA